MVSKRAFEDTQNKGETLHKRLQAKKDLIQANWGLDWNNVEYRDLDSPFISGLAARLFISNDPNPLPAEEELDLQARYWIDNYHKSVDADEAVATLKRASRLGSENLKKNLETGKVDFKARIGQW
ncbi:unnamed protein product [Owenia fusiformis]|uniref:Uncharacterized protein n=1 Tax=Owenia fusiformis TaxID=6347 RepID=A0A8J1TDF6_OWEFU|nr:unnamed protein product [Owenia fusiformis]